MVTFYYWHLFGSFHMDEQSHLICSTIQLSCSWMSVYEYLNLNNTNLILVISVVINWKLQNSWHTVCKKFYYNSVHNPLM